MRRIALAVLLVVVALTLYGCYQVFHGESNMTYPGYPTNVGGRYRYGPQDQQTQSWLFQEFIPAATGGEWVTIGYVFDDGTPNLVSTWLPIAQAEAAKKGWIVVVLVAWGRRGFHHPGVHNMLEVYWKCSGVSLARVSAIMMLPQNHYGGYVMAKTYGRQDRGETGSRCIPTNLEYRILRRFLSMFRPKYGLWDF